MKSLSLSEHIILCPLQRLLVTGCSHEDVTTSGRVEVAVIALAPAEWDVQIQAQRVSHKGPPSPLAQCMWSYYTPFRQIIQSPMFRRFFQK